MGFAWLLALAGVLGVSVALRSHYAGLLASRVDQISSTASLLQSPADLPTLVVDMGFSEYDDLLAQRQQALDVGVYVHSTSDFVTATVRVGDSAMPVAMRLAAGPALRLGDDDKWGFEVRTRDGSEILGMQRFYLSDPPVNNFLSQWAFAHALSAEGVLSARYGFVRLVFNGDERGIYAMQEGFSEDLLSRQGRPDGVVVQFDTTLLWQSLAHFQASPGTVYLDPVANLTASDYQFFEVETARSDRVKSDPALAAQQDIAVGLLRALQTGTLDASSVFDLATYARFLALTDLWGSLDGTSLVNLRYFYNSESQRLEPIGFNSNPLASAGRLPLASTYGSPLLQAAYVREATHYSQPEYVDKLEADLGAEWSALQKALGSEYGRLDPPWAELRVRQEQIRASLDPVQAVLAYVEPPPSSASQTLHVEIANILNLPVEIVGFDMDGFTFWEADPHKVDSPSADLLVESADRLTLRSLGATRAPVVRFVSVDLQLHEILGPDAEFDPTDELEIRIITRVLGSSHTQETLAKWGYPPVLSAGVVD
jgi:hypothetical protein